MASSSRHISALLASLAFIASVAVSTSAFAACPPNYPKNLPCPKEAWETIQLEHRDRTARLRRLAQGRVDFEFHEDQIQPRELGLPDFPVTVPVLRVVANQSAFFDSGSDVIRPEAYPLLDIIAGSLMLEPPDVSLFIAGHTDSNGSIEYNYDLGLARAQAVAAALVRRGIYQAAIYRVSFGKLVPIADNATAGGRARNRRVEFLFSAKTAAIVAILERQPVAACAEEFRDAVGSCRLPIKIEAAKVSVPISSQPAVIELDREYQGLAADRTLSPVELETKRSEIEVAREKIPVDLSVEKIPIDLSGN